MLSVGLRWLVDEIKYWFHFQICPHHNPWRLCCMLDRQGVRWLCCECGKRREMFL